MRLNEIDFPDGLPVDGYGPGFFRVGGAIIDGALLLTAHGAQSWGGYEDSARLTALAGEVDVIFLGTGAEIAHPPAELRRMIEEAGMGLEAMASPSACRTYNVLLSEGRRVALAALPV